MELGKESHSASISQVKVVTLKKADAGEVRIEIPSTSSLSLAPWLATPWQILYRHENRKLPHYTLPKTFMTMESVIYSPILF